MPSPVTPDQFKELIPGPGGSLCEKLVKKLFRQLAERVYALVAYERNPDGTISEEMKADICALECAGGTQPPGTLAAPTNVMATDGEFNDKVRITWSTVSGAEIYDIFRNTVNDSTAATSIGTTTSLTFDDTSVTPGTTYYYWVQARSGAMTSPLSASDMGYAAIVLTVVTTLDASHGLAAATSTATVTLVFNAVIDADSYDIYRGTSSIFSEATRIDTNRQPFDNSESLYLCSPFPCTKPLFVNNGGTPNELLYADTVPNRYTKYTYWVVAKKTSGGEVIGISAESNSSEGWASGNGTGLIPLSDGFANSGSIPQVVPAGVTKAWLAFFPTGAGGAGGDANMGGGGGGGGALLAGEIPVIAGKNIKVISVPEADGAGGASATSAGAGSITKVQYDGSGSYLDILTSNAAGGGIYASGGGGAGGAGSTGSADASVTDLFYRAGRAGTAAAANKGGRGGHRWGGARPPGNNLNGQPTIGGAETGRGTNGNGAGGSWATPSGAASASGGTATRGLVVMIFYT